jgi:hypothetical protein
MLSGADLVLVSQVAAVVDIVVPSKLITSFGAGAMIIAACAPDSEAARLIADSGGGITIGAGDDAALVTTIRRLQSGGVDSAAYRRRARAFALSRFERRAVYGPVVARLREAGG